jgi:hypothetical protein
VYISIIGLFPCHMPKLVPPRLAMLVANDTPTFSLIQRKCYDAVFPGKPTLQGCVQGYYYNKLMYVYIQMSYGNV